MSETSDGLFSQITTIVLTIISGISISVMSASLWLLRKAKQQIRNLSMNQKQDEDVKAKQQIRNLSMNQKQVEDVYVNQSSIINQANMKDVSEDVYMYSMPTEQHIYTDLKTK
ncbi:uncharacterized protein LOC117121407 [Anneissia japonica]|uniref:uncharacterized protein LOC117121407 n=1 Tax=Anneissia japonica TaxID=1529436 RepID=UPI0014257878|nr:uncharacterized protein LOC117121407 [Anneissia japonica]